MNRIIGESSTLVETLDHVSRVAPVNRPVLVFGERGSGKEMIAERLHFLSKRWDESFHKVNCAAISEQLLDSELFGHESGAFTGATRRHIGRFERADGGTLFLDELGTLPLRIQEKLLRIIEYGEFERLGGQDTMTVDVRIVAATNENLPQKADKGEFRHDLLDRLAFDVVHVPPLRERLDDIPQLVEFFATRMCMEMGYEYYSGFSDKAMSAMLSYHWPGNIRELKNVVERSICHWGDADEPIEEAKIVVFPDLSKVQTKSSASFAEQASECHQLPDGADSTGFNERVKKLELQLIREALTACGKHQGKSAKQLGLSYHQFRALLRKYKDDLE